MGGILAHELSLCQTSIATSQAKKNLVHVSVTSPQREQTSESMWTFLLAKAFLVGMRSRTDLQTKILHFKGIQQPFHFQTRLTPASGTSAKAFTEAVEKRQEDSVLHLHLSGLVLRSRPPNKLRQPSNSAASSELKDVFDQHHLHGPAPPPSGNRSDTQQSFFTSIANNLGHLSINGPSPNQESIQKRILSPFPKTPMIEL
ncbi:hypothetical protein Hanom_Chr04g00286801 [Helianthus anomalus]